MGSGAHVAAAEQVPRRPHTMTRGKDMVSSSMPWTSALVHDRYLTYGMLYAITFTKLQSSYYSVTSTHQTVMLLFPV